jgi:hypothetical protein
MRPVKQHDYDIHVYQSRTPPGLCFLAGVQGQRQQGQFSQLCAVQVAQKVMLQYESIDPVELQSSDSLVFFSLADRGRMQDTDLDALLQLACSDTIPCARSAEATRTLEAQLLAAATLSRRGKLALIEEFWRVAVSWTGSGLSSPAPPLLPQPGTATHFTHLGEVLDTKNGQEWLRLQPTVITAGFALIVSIADIDIFITACGLTVYNTCGLLYLSCIFLVAYVLSDKPSVPCQFLDRLR